MLGWGAPLIFATDDSYLQLIYVFVSMNSHLWASGGWYWTEMLFCFNYALTGADQDIFGDIVKIKHRRIYGPKFS